jgi:ribonuclease P/MRP protein subunit RPP40
LILPEEIHELCQQELDGHLGTLRYTQVNMSLLEVISGEFFTEYIKKGITQYIATLRG